jgi:hypothetical protein
MYKSKITLCVHSVRAYLPTPVEFFRFDTTLCVTWTQSKGAEPEALVNFAALLGARWHDASGDDKKAVDIMSMPELIDKVVFVASSKIGCPF